LEVMDLEWRFIGEPITVEFERHPLFSKKPSCPARFIWGEERLAIGEVLREWRDYGRRGRMASNMQPEHASRAAIRGSWGVGRYYFRVRVADGRVFEIYYDRAPKGAGQRQGAWFLDRQLLGE